MAPVLEGIKVIDVSQVAAVPMTARIMADFGADVIHVEHPRMGDQFRAVLDGMGSTSGIVSDINYVWEHYNRNKKGITLDLSQNEGLEILNKMLETADVFLSNLRPYELEKFSLEYDALKKLNPRLVAGYLTGYGMKGPGRNAPAYDHTAYWARSGIPHRLISLTPALQNPGAHPPAFLPAFGDHMAGMSLACGVMMALFRRERTGQGEEVNVSLFHAGAYQLSFDVAGALATGNDCLKRTSTKDTPNALIGQYQTKDGRWILFCFLRPDRYWANLCQAMGREDLVHDPRFASLELMTKNRVAMIEILDEVFLSKTLDEWRPLLDEAELPWAPVQNLLEVVNDPQARANDFWVAYDHPEYGRIEGVTCPIKLGQEPDPVRMPAPEFSQHTEEILLECGYTWEDIVRFKDNGVIA
jgi:crotonobetainyl-CoA:carnitine CoA-transferase CaiB-like acyl-CoA transferase